MQLVDVHCHLNHALFKDDLPLVLERAKNAGVKAIIVSGPNVPSNREVLKLAEKYPILKASLGLHPIDALGLSEGETGLPKQKGKVDLEEEFKFIEKNKDKIIAVGEVGMDFHWADKEKTGQEQAEIFRKVVKFAVKLGKPLVVHSWEAEEECLNILEEEIKNKEIPVINHCFGGRKSLITKAAELGHYFSIPPHIIKSSNFQTLVKKVPLEQLFTETDAPWLSPFPDQKNEPAFVVEAIKKIAEIKNLTPEEVADQIWKNYEKVF